MTISNSVLSNEEEPTPTAVSILPPLICNNPRKKIEPEWIESKKLSSTTRQRPKREKQLVSYPIKEPLPTPSPRSLLTIYWSPDPVCFDLEEEPIIRKLSIRNGCSRIIYLHCCGLWNDTARLGASWRTYPRTRFLLAPGLKKELFIKATPRHSPPIPRAELCLQLAASHMRDHVTGYFGVPLVAVFLKYQLPHYGEDG